MEGEETLGTITIEHRDGVDVVCMLGEHDMSTRSTLTKVIEDTTKLGRGLVLSLVETEFIDSTVIRSLYWANELQREQNRRLVVHVHTHSIVRRTLDFANVCETVACTGDIEEALALASNGAGAAP